MSVRPKTRSDDGAKYAINRINCPRLIRKLGKCELAAACQRVHCCGYNGERIIEKDFRAKLVRQAANYSRNRKLNISLSQFSVKCPRVPGDHMKEHTWILPGQPIDGGQNDS